VMRTKVLRAEDVSFRVGQDEPAEKKGA